MTGAHELCMLIDGVVKRYPTAVVEFNTPYYKGTTKVLCMESPVQDIIIGNIPGALGAEIKSSNDHDEIAKSVKDMKQTKDDVIINHNIENIDTDDQGDDPEKQDVSTDEQLTDRNHTNAQCAAVKTRAMVAKEGRPPVPLKTNSVPIHGLDIGPEELKLKQKADSSLKKYWELADKSVDGDKQQFITKKGILYRKYCGKQNADNLNQLVVPSELREKVVSLAHDTLLAGHRGALELHSL